MTKQNSSISTILLLSILLLSGCLTSRKIDNFVAEQFNNELPKPEKKKNPDITVSTTISTDPLKISNTETKTSKVLPLLLYWQYDYRHTSTLNAAIAVSNFRKNVYLQANKGLNQKLNGRQLELNVEQVPVTFASVDKEHFLWLVYIFHWNRLYVEPDSKDLVVSYKILQNGSETKSGKISIKNKGQNQAIRFFQSWKSATSEYLGQYNLDIADMTKTFVTNLIQEL